MSVSDLREQIAVEFEAMERTLAEIDSLCRDVGEREPSTREMAAAGLFLANLYNGVENILKRLCLHHGAPLPSGATWHVELLNAFCSPTREGLPPVLDAGLQGDLAAYRRFRHVVHHGYGFRLEWKQMRPGLTGARDVVRRFRRAVEAHVRAMERGEGEE